MCVAQTRFEVAVGLVLSNSSPSHTVRGEHTLSDVPVASATMYSSPLHGVTLPHTRSDRLVPCFATYSPLEEQVVYAAHRRSDVRVAGTTWYWPSLQLVQHPCILRVKGLVVRRKRPIQSSRTPQADAVAGSSTPTPFGVVNLFQSGRGRRRRLAPSHL